MLAIAAVLLAGGETRAATSVVTWGGTGYVTGDQPLGRTLVLSTSDFDGGGTANDNRYSLAYDESTSLNPSANYSGTSATFYGGLSYIVYDSSFATAPNSVTYNLVANNAGGDQIRTYLADAALKAKRLDVLVLWKKADFLALSGVPIALDSTSTQKVVTVLSATPIELRCLVNDSGNLYVSSNNVTVSSTLTITNPVTETWAQIDTNAGYANMHRWTLGAYSNRTFKNVEGLGYYVVAQGTQLSTHFARVTTFTGMAVQAPNSAPTIDQGAGPLTPTLDEGASPTAWSAPTLSATDTDGDTLTWAVKTQASHGTATVSGTGASPATFTYATTDPDYCGTDSFVVKVTDPASAEDTITVNVTINPRNDAPVCTVVPVVSGTHFEGNSLSTSDGTWNDTKDTAFNVGYTFTPSYAYHWQRADDAAGTGAADIGGATASAYTLVGADVGKYVRVRVTCTDNGDGTPAAQGADAYSTPWQLVTVNNVTPTFGQASPVAQTIDEDGAPTAWAAPTLTASDTDPGDTAILQWSVATQAVHGVATVSGTGATPATFTYAPSASYNGSDTFWVKISDGKPLGDALIRVDVTINARNDAPVNTVAPSVSGTHERGQVLAATDGTWNDNTDTQYAGSFSPSYTYQWQRADDAIGTGAADIGSATANTYTLALADVTKYVRIRVTCTDDGVGDGGNQSAQAYSTPWTLVASAPITWTGSDGTDNHWARTANWSPTMAPTTGDEILFTGTPSRLDPYLEANYSISKLTFASGAASLALGAAPGATLTFTGNTVSNSSVNAQTNNMPMLLSSVVTMSAAAGDLVVGGALTGASGGITKTGVKALTLSGDNNLLAGGVTLAAGKLNINHNNALGSGTLTINASTTNDNTSGGEVTIGNLMAWNGDFTFTGTTNLTQQTGAVTLSANRQVTVSAKTLTVNGAIGDGGNSRTLTKAGAGTLVLGGNNTYDGLTTVSAGTLTISGNNSAADGGVTLSAGTLNVNHNNALGSGALTIGGGTINNTSVSAVTLANAMNWNASFAFNGTQNVTQDTGAVTLSGNPAVTVTGTLTVNGTAGGSSGLTKTGAGTLVLGGNNTFNGALTVQQGALSLAYLDDSHNGSGTIALGSGASTAGELIYAGAASSTARGISLPATTTGGGTITVNGGPLTFTAATFNTAAGTTKTLTLQGTGNGTISGVITNGAATALAVTKSGAGAWTLSGNNTYSGLTTVSAGALTLSGDNSSMSGGLSVSGGATLNIAHAKALGTGLLTFAINSTFDNTSGSALTVTTDPVIKWSTANQTFSGTHDLDLGAGVVTNHGQSARLTVNNSRLTLRGPIRGGADSSLRYLIKDGSGTLVLLGNSTDYWGKTSVGSYGINVVSGIVEFANGALGDMEDAKTDTISLSTGTTLRWVSGNTQDISKRLSIGASQSVTLDLQENNVSFFYALDNAQASAAGVIITKLGSGTLTLANLAAKNAGTFRLYGGTVIAQARNNLLSSGTIGFNNNGTLKFGAVFDASTGTMTFNAGGATLDTQAFDITLANAVGNSGAGGLTKKGSGSLTLSGNNTYAGGTTLDEGILILNHNAALGTGSGALLTLKAGTTLDAGAAAPITLANNPVQSWQGNFTYTGTSGRTLNLGSGTVTMTGSRQVTISAGNLTVGGIDGTGYSLEKLGAGTMEITRASTYSGNTTVTGGALKLSGSGTIASSPVITLGGSGTFNVSGFTLASGQTLLGTGTVAGPLTIGSGSTLSPGASGAIGTLSQTSGTSTLAGGGTYQWELSSVSAGAGDQDADKGTAFDWINGSGAALDISATSGSKFTIKITRLGASIANWDNTQSYSWTIATAASGITGFSAGKFMLDTSAFGEAMGAGTFYLSVVGNDLRLNFTTSMNNPPQIQEAGALTTTMSEGGTPTGWLLTTDDVSAIDADGGDTLTWSVGTVASHGTASVSGTGAHPAVLTYAPLANYYGADSFWVKVDDGNGGEDTIEVQVTVSAINDAPVCTIAPGITGTRIAGNILTVTNGVWDDNADTNAAYRHIDFTNSAVFAYQWRRADDSAGSSNVTNLFSQTNATYTLVTPDDRYKWFSVQVSCTDTGVPGPGVTTVTNTAWLQETSSVPVVVVFSNSVDTTWGLYSNWKPSSVPAATMAAVIGDTAVLSPATVTLASGAAAVTNLYLGTNSGSKGILNITGGTLTFPAAGKIVVAGATSSTGTLNQTGGTLAGITSGDLSIAAGSGSTGTVVLGGTTTITSTWSIASGANSIGTLTLTNTARWQQSGANTRTVGGSAGAMGYLNVLGDAVMSCLDGANPRGVTLGPVAGSTGELMIGDDARLTGVSPLTIASAGNARATVRDRGQIGGSLLDIGSGANGTGDLLLTDNAYVFNVLRMGHGAGSVSTLTMSNSAVFNQGSTDIFIVGNANNALATVYMNDGAILNPGNRGFVLGNVSGSTGIVVMTGGSITNSANAGFFTIGNLGYGKMTIGGTGAVYVATLNVSGTNGGSTAVNSEITLAGSGLLRVTAAANLGNVAGARGQITLQAGTWSSQAPASLGNAAGAEGDIQVTGGTWLQSGSLTVAAVPGSTGLVTVANCTQTNITGAVTVGGGTAGDRYGSIVISNATFGGGMRVMVLTNGYVNLVGTGSVLRCNSFTNNGGYVTNHVRRFSGGVDITNSAVSAFVITNGGKMFLAFDERPVADGDLWGLRWLGNGHAAQLQGLTNSGDLSWEDSAVSGKVQIYTNETHTMVGYVAISEGSIFKMR